MSDKTAKNMEVCATDRPPTSGRAGCCASAFDFDSPLGISNPLGAMNSTYSIITQIQGDCEEQVGGKESVA
jgi:hypothetical protein